MSAEVLWIGFMLGLLGSFHCIGMCGPLALSLPLRGHSFLQKTIGSLLYNAGRILTYGILGALLGLLGQGLMQIGIQQWITIAVGLLLIGSVVMPFFSKKINLSLLNQFIKPVRKSIQLLFKQKTYSALFLIGLLNGLLPCGLVYTAIVSAIAVGNVYYSSLYLALFGLGTLPMMLALPLIGQAISLGVRKTINRLLPYIIVSMGVLFVLRGLCLGIPYISPSKNRLETTMQQTATPTCPTKVGMPHNCCQPK